MDAVLAVAAIVASYLLGTVPSAIVVARSKGVDITSIGSGNPGASNVSRALGAKWGVLVFVMDAAKGALPSGLALLDGRPLAYACGAAAILGHVFPATRGFRGGKGIATGAGVLLPLHPPVIVGAALTWLVIMKSTKRASIASIVTVPVVLLAVLLRGTAGWEVASLVGIALLVETRHLSNIRRLFSGTEHSISHDSR